MDQGGRKKTVVSPAPKTSKWVRTPPRSTDPSRSGSSALIGPPPPSPLATSRPRPAAQPVALHRAAHRAAHGVAPGGVHLLHPFPVLRTVPGHRLELPPDLLVGPVLVQVAHGGPPLLQVGEIRGVHLPLPRHQPA